MDHTGALLMSLSIAIAGAIPSIMVIYKLKPKNPNEFVIKEVSPSKALLPFTLIIVAAYIGMALALYRTLRP